MIRIGDAPGNYRAPRAEESEGKENEKESKEIGEAEGDGKGGR